MIIKHNSNLKGHLFIHSEMDGEAELSNGTRTISSY